MIKRKNDQVLKNIEQNIKALDGSSVDIGLFKGSEAKKSRIEGSEANVLAYRWALNDQGIDGIAPKRIPKRETLTPTMDDLVDKDDPFIVRVFKTIHKQRSANEQTVKAMGVRLSEKVAKAVVNLKTPPKSKLTIDIAERRYGGIRDNPLIQTAEMKNAITFRRNK